MAKTQLPEPIYFGRQKMSFSAPTFEKALELAREEAENIQWGKPEGIREKIHRVEIVFVSAELDLRFPGDSWTFTFEALLWGTE